MPSSLVHLCMPGYTRAEDISLTFTSYATISHHPFDFPPNIFPVCREQSRNQHTKLTWLKLPAHRKRLHSVLHATISSMQALKYSERMVDQPCRKNSFYEPLEAVYDPSYQTKSSLRSVDRKELLTENDSILNRWSEHFHSLFTQSIHCKRR